jgi:class 3 adenylate cyclase
MKAHIRTLLNLLSVTLVVTALVLFFVHLLYTSDVRERHLAGQKQTVMFVVSMLDERAGPLSAETTRPGNGSESGPAPAVFSELAASIADYYDLNDRVRLTVFALQTEKSPEQDTAGDIRVGEPVYADTPGTILDEGTLRSVREALQTRARQAPEGEINFEEGYGYFFTYPALDLGIVAWSRYDQVFATRNLVLYLLGGAFGLFAVFIFLIHLGLVRRWRWFRRTLEESISPVLEGLEPAPKQVDKSMDAESAGFLDLYNNLAERLQKTVRLREEKISRLVNQYNKLQRILLLHKKYLPQEALHRLNEDKLGDMASSRRTVVSITLELVDYLKPSQDLYPQTITNELQNFHTFLKNHASRDGGIINYTRGYKVNVVYGVHGDDEGKPSDMVGAAAGLFEKVQSWIEERNQSEMNVSGVHWLVQAGAARGKAVAGVVGDGYLVMGAPVEESERILEHAKRYQIPLVCTDQKALRQISYNHRKLDLVELEGQQVPLFEVFTRERPQLEQVVTLYEHGVYMFYEGRYEIAVQNFKKVMVLFENDVPSSIFLERCAEKLKKK